MLPARLAVVSFKNGRMRWISARRIPSWYTWCLSASFCVPFIDSGSVDNITFLIKIRSSRVTIVIHAFANPNAYVLRLNVELWSCKLDGWDDCFVDWLEMNAWPILETLYFLDGGKARRPRRFDPREGFRSVFFGIGRMFCALSNLPFGGRDSLRWSLVDLNKDTIRTRLTYAVSDGFTACAYGERVFP